jgi:hypothetical protein
MTRLRPLVSHQVLYTVVALVCFASLVVPSWAQFETRATHSLPGESSAVVVGDFNRDGKLDVAVTAGEALVVLLGNGNGTFTQGATYSGVFYSIATADFNNDGILDLVVANENNSVSVFLGNGDGTFQAPKTSPTTDFCSFIAVGNFNGDNNMDLAVADGPYVSVLLGNGDGTFQAPIDNDSFPDTPVALALADFNNDQLLDVAVVGSFGSAENFGILLGNGNGTLQSAQTYPLVYEPCGVAAADFRNNGLEDLAVGACGAAVTVFLGNGDGTFGAGTNYSGGGDFVFIGDFNGDGKLDMIGTPENWGVAEFLGNGDGTFQPVKISLSGVPGILWATGDFNNDHQPDALLLDTNKETITTMLNTGALDFSPSSPLSFPSQLIGTSSNPKKVQLTNTGASAITIGSVKASEDFRVTSTCGSSLAAGASCDLDVIFEPASAGKHVGLVTILDNASSKPQVIEVSGIGKAGAYSYERD